MSVSAEIVLVLLFLDTIPHGQSIENTFCVGTGYSNLSEKGYGLISMGASSLYIHPVSTFWGANLMALPIASRADRPAIRIHSVSETLPNGNKQQLRGWLYLEIEKSANEYFNALAVWAFSPGKRSSGEFVYFPNTNCGLWPDLKNYVPCSAVAVDMPVTSNMFIYTDDGSRKERVFKLLWRLPSSYCNKPEGVYFLMAFNSAKWNRIVAPFHIKEGQRDVKESPTELGPMLIRSRFIYIPFYGTSAPIFNPSSLSCTAPTSEIQDTMPSWIKKLGGGRYGAMAEVDKEWTFERWHYLSGVESQDNFLFGSTCKAQISGLRVFGGRCLTEASADYPTYAGDDKSPECLQNAFAWDPAELRQLETNGLFKRVLEDRSAQVGTGCDPDCKTTPIPTKEEIVNLVNTVRARSSSISNELEGTSSKYISKAYGCADRKNETDRDLFGLCSLTEAGQTIYGVRQYHGLVMFFCSLIIIPTQCFLARYCKGPIPISPETGDPYIPVRRWYITHVLLTIPVIGLSGSAMASVHRQLTAMGYSKTLFARVHCWVGYAFFVVFFFQMLSGFLRPQNIRLRHLAIFLHWLVGTILNYGGVVLCMFTYGIPSSPTSHQSHLRPEKFYKMYYHVVPLILLLWFVFEGLYHIPMFIYAIRFDRKHNINRTQFPVFLPPNVNNRYLLLDGDYRAKAALIMKTFGLYVGTCSLIYIACVVAVYIGEEDTEMGLGPMSCTHDQNNKYITGFSNEDSVELRQFYIDNHCEHFLHV